MILGLFLSRLDLPVLPVVVIVAAFLVLIAGFAFMIYRHVYEKGESDIDPAVFRKVCDIAAWVFIIYVLVELIAAAACVCVNEACRYGYHYDLSKKDGVNHILCKFCNGFKDADNRSFASDALMLGIYFDAFIVNSFVTNTVRFVREKLDGRRKDA